MKEENEKYLFTRFSKFFGVLNNPQDNLMCFGFEHGDGWYTIILTLMEEIEKVCTETNTSIQVQQVKEKFGTLRFYIQFNGSTQKDETIRKQAYERIYELIERAEARTEFVCEGCGEPSVQPNPSQGWVRTLCEKCWNEYKKAHYY